MGCCFPEYGGAEDTTGMRVFDSFRLSSRWWSSTVGRQKCNIRSCWTWIRRMKGEERMAKDDFQLFSGKHGIDHVVSGHLIMLDVHS